MREPLWEIDRTLKAKGFRLSNPPSTYIGPVFPYGNKVIVEIEISDFSFSELPVVRLIDADELPVQHLAHVNTDDTICYTGQGGLPLDVYNPGGSILRVLEEAKETLERSFADGATAEYEAELASYWKGTTIYVALPSSETNAIFDSELIVFGIGEKQKRALVPTGKWKNAKTSSRQPTTTISFNSTLKHTPAFKSENLADFIDWIKRQPNGPAGLQEKIITSAADSKPVFVVSPNALIGWHPVFPPNIQLLKSASGVRKSFLRKQLVNSLSNVGLRKMTGLQLDLKQVVKRNLYGKTTLIEKKISMVGCGTIGGHLAKLLVQSGAGCEERFNIYDTDILRPGNLGRHVLGYSDLERPKAIALAEHLGQFHPDVQIAPFHRNAVQDWSSIERSDLIIDATGDYNVATALNELRMNSKRSGDELAILHTWVFGNGIAAQSFLNLNDGLACYHCLKPIFGGSWRQSPAKDVKAPQQIAPANCGEAGYVPFSADAPTVAAALTLRAVLDWAEHQPGQRLRTVTLNHAEGNDVKWTSPKRSNSCGACNG